jgi:DNA-binding FrmR family transcriptional regulator
MKKNSISSKPRTVEEKQDLSRRLKIIAGQINGLQQMVEDDRSCNDILLQVASVSSALRSFGNELLKSHMKSCMVEDIMNGKIEVIDEVIDLFGKIK